MLQWYFHISSLLLLRPPLETCSDPVYWRADTGSGPAGYLHVSQVTDSITADEHFRETPTQRWAITHQFLLVVVVENICLFSVKLWAWHRAEKQLVWVFADHAHAGTIPSRKKIIEHLSFLPPFIFSMNFLINVHVERWKLFLYS